MITRRIEIGIDISADWFDACFPVGKKREVVRFTNDEPGRLAFLDRIRSLDAASVHVAMEFTGGCETALALLCHKSGIAVSLLDGLKVSRFRESLGRAKAKNDRADARLITRYLKERRPAQWSPRPEEYRVLTELVRHRTDLVNSRKAWNCRIRHVPMSELVAAQREAQLEIYNLQIEEIEKAIKAHVSAHETLAQAVRLLCTIPGISSTSAARLLAEMGPIQNYANPRQLALCAGLCPVESQSGKGKSQGRLVVYGNRELRNALYMPAMVAIRVKSALAVFAERIRSNGSKSKKTVQVATMRKLAQIIHGMLSKGLEYDPDLLIKHMKQGA